MTTAVSQDWSSEVNNRVQTNIDALRDELADFIARISQKYRTLVDYVKNDAKLLQACKPTDFVNQHMGWGLDRIIADVAWSDQRHDGLTEIRYTMNRMHQILNGNQADKPIKVGARIEHPGFEGPGVAHVLDTEADVLLHTNPIEGGGLFRSAVLESLLKRRNKIDHPIAPECCTTGSLINPTDIINPFTSVAYHFAQDKLVRATRVGTHYNTSFTVLADSTFPTTSQRRTIAPGTQVISTFTADYRFEAGKIMGFIRDRWHGIGKSRGFTAHAENGQISSSGNVEGRMVLNWGDFQLYWDQRTILKNSVKMEELPPNRRFATQLSTNILADIGPVRGVGLEIYFIFLKNQQRVPTQNLAYNGEHVVITNDIAEVTKYFSNFDLRKPNVNPELSLLIGCRELFTPGNQFYVLPEVGLTIDASIEAWRSELPQFIRHHYRFDNLSVTEAFRHGSKRDVLKACTTENPTQRWIVKVNKPDVDDDPRVKGQGRVSKDLSRTDAAFAALGKKTDNFQGREHVVTDILPHDDGVRIGPDGKEEKISYLVCKPYDTTLEQLYPVGKRMPLEFFIRDANSILLGATFIHEHRLTHLDFKLDNVAVELDSTGAGYTVKIDDFEDSRPEGAKLTLPDICSIDTRAPEIQRIKGNDPATHIDSTLQMDVFSISAMLARLIMGRYPFSPMRVKPAKNSPDRSAYDAEVNEKKLDSDYSQVHSEIIRECPREIAQFIIKGLAARPQDRYEKATQMLEEYRHIAAIYDVLQVVSKNLTGIYEGKKDLALHCQRARAMLLELYPNASIIEMLAMELHDAERRKKTPMVWDQKSDYAKHKVTHAKVCASEAMDIVRKSSLTKAYVSELTKEQLNSLQYIVMHHDDAVLDTRSTDNQLLQSSAQKAMDADGLTFFMYEFANYTRRGNEQLKTKVRFMYGKMSAHARASMETKGVMPRVSKYLKN